MASRGHADHDYIVARQERYVASYRRGNAKAMMDFMDEDDFVYSDFGEETSFDVVSLSSSLSRSLFLALFFSLFFMNNAHLLTCSRMNLGRRTKGRDEA